MKYGIAIRNMGPQSNRNTIRECARIAESANFDALFVSDHLCIPPDQTEGSGGRYLDVLATLAFLAGATDRIRLGVSVLVLPYRPAVLTAKQVATIQELSGDRMILGVGVGWMKPEFDALGIDLKKRGAISTETLAVIRHLWDSEQPRPYSGKLVNFPAFVFLPRPERPPIWIGGHSAAALDRVVKFGDGWHPMLKPAELKPAVDALKAKMKAAGKPAPEIIVRRGLKLDDPAAASERIQAESDAGATYFILDLGRYQDELAFGRAVDIFMDQVAIR
ncbi:MAG TPA: TIGR03619 family F420-dependent LLM class oxidoreductase [Candidatus Binataceae bacterium]|nr:TIGR03619 family F420-dependent LLM class oxidoreductase [Candidatus Binataceae bacterium]